MIARPNRRGFTLMEVMIAVTVLLAALLAVLGGVFNLDKARQTTRDNVKVHALERALLERFAACAAEDLNTTAAPWSLARLRDANGNGDPDDDQNWLTDDPATAASSDPDQLRRVVQTVPGKATLGLIDGPTGLASFRTWIEYYRGVSATDDKGQAIPGKSGGVFEETGLDPFKPLYRLPGSSSLADLVMAQEIGPNDVVAIRIIMSWTESGGAARTFTIVTGRKP